MTIYAVTDGEYSDYHIVALTINKERAEHIAKFYDNAEIEEYEDAQQLPENPMWCYSKLFSSCRVLEPGEERSREGIVGAGAAVYVRAEDEAHARKKAQDMLAKYKAKQEGIT